MCCILLRAHGTNVRFTQQIWLAVPHVAVCCFAEAAAREGLTVRITNMRADSVRAADTDTSDPYVEIRAGKERIRSPVIKKTLDPNWAGFEAVIGSKQDLELLERIEFWLFDQDGLRDDDLGSVKVSMDSIWRAHNECITISEVIEYNGHDQGTFHADIQVLGDLSRLMSQYVALSTVVCFSLTSAEHVIQSCALS